ncbi:MAG: ATP-binding protein [Candidatus Marinimicrobia bacterium]|nr:ATP-binding protein [Candidatus Neomarinimicrobiota bacterium]
MVAGSEGSELRVYIKDTGIGISAHGHEAVFNRFEQADIADTGAIQGSGLGLAISKAYVEILGGNMWFRKRRRERLEHFISPYLPKIM